MNRFNTSKVSDRFSICIHHTAAALLLSAVNPNERGRHPVTLCSVFTISTVSSRRDTQMKAIPAHAKTTGYVSPTTWNYILLRSAGNVKGSHLYVAICTQTLTQVRTRIHIWSVFVPVLQWWKCRHSGRQER